VTIGVLVGLAVAAAPPMTTDERFTVGPKDFDGPCLVKISKPAEVPPPECAAAIAAARTPKEKAILYFAWAYSLNEVDGAIEALPNLDKAVALAPNFGNARHERSYTLNDLGFYDRALIDSNRDVEISPKAADAYSERAFARHRLGDFAGALADRLKVIELDGSNHDREVGVAEELMWLGRYDEAYKRLSGLSYAGDQKLLADIDHRRQFRPDGTEAKRCEMKSVEDQATADRIIDACTWAFDHETDPAKRADYLTTRGAMTVVARQDQGAGWPDMQLAVAIDPINPNRHSNYGFALISIRHSWAARNAFERALALPNLDKRAKALALAGRGIARANLGDTAGAWSDAKASFELEPLAPNTLLLGDLAFERGDKAAAKKFWMATYTMGSRDDSLGEKLKSVGVDHPENEPR